LNILSEKPVAINHADLDRVERTLRSTGVRLSAMFAMRYAPPIYTVWRTVGRGEIGKPCLARAQKSYKWGDGRPWFYQYKDIYGSTILWVGIHAVDYLRWCVGLEVSRVSGFHSNLAHPESPGAQDNATVSMEFEGGATAAITMDYLRPETAPTHGDDRIRIAGSKGIVEALAEKGIFDLVTNETKPHEVELEEPDLPLLADFVGELRGQRKSLIGSDEAVRVTRICIAATEAAEKQQTITV
jgi:predicted dehydrogenase